MTVSIDIVRTPASVFETAVAAYLAGDCAAVAALCDPNSLIVHQRSLTTSLFSSTLSREELLVLSPQDSYALYLESRSLRHLYNGRIPNSQPTSEQLKIIDAIMRGVFDLRVVGVVHEDDTFAHVLFRRAACAPLLCEDPDWAADLPVELRDDAKEIAIRAAVNATTCRRQPDGTWRLVADLEFFTNHSGAICLDEAPAQGDNAGPLPE